MREEKKGIRDMMEIPSDKKGPRPDFHTKTGKTMGKKGLEKARDFWKESGQKLKGGERTVGGIVHDYTGD